MNYNATACGNTTTHKWNQAIQRSFLPNRSIVDHISINPGSCFYKHNRSVALRKKKLQPLSQNQQLILEKIKHSKYIKPSHRQRMVRAQQKNADRKNHLLLFFTFLQLTQHIIGMTRHMREPKPLFKVSQRYRKNTQCDDHDNGMKWQAGGSSLVPLEDPYVAYRMMKKGGMKSEVRR